MSDSTKETTATSPEVTKDVKEKAPASESADLPKQIWTELNEAIAICPFTKPTSEILNWRDPIRSGLVFAIVNLFFFLITIGEYSVMTLSSYIFLLLVGVSFAYTFYLNFKGTAQNALAEAFKESDFGMPQEALTQTVQSCHLTLEVVRKLFFQVFFARDYVFAGSVCGAVFLISQFGKLFSGTFLIYLTILIAFVWPRVYEMKKKEIDAAVAQAVALAAAKLKPLLEKLPKAKKD